MSELEMNAMLKKNFKGRCEKMSISKSKEVCRTYSEIQKKYVELFEVGESKVHFDAYEYQPMFSDWCAVVCRLMSVNI